MADKKDLETTEKVEDPELDELLDSALEDLTKKPVTLSEKEKESPNNDSEKAENDKKEDEANWTDEFIKQAAAQFESNMSNALGGSSSVSSDQIQQNFQKMAEAAAQVMSNPTALEATPQSNDFAATISQTLQNLSLGAENLQNPFSESDILNLFGGQSGAGSGEEVNQFLPFMQGMMQSLLSKDVLYPSLKDILDRYPAWLEEHRGTLPLEDVDRYEKQIKLMNDVCSELEKENDQEAENVKRERFEKVLGLMQKMQDLGQPPMDLVGEPVTAGLRFDTQGNPILPTDLDPNQCSLM